MLSFRNKQESVKWSNNLFAENSPFYIVDTETGGKPNYKTGEFPEPISIAILKCDANGYEVVYNQLIYPMGEIEAGASEVHGYTKDMLKDKPNFADIYLDVAKLLHKEVCIAYNASFDFPVLDKVCDLYRLPYIKPRSISCAMLAYSAFNGEKHPTYGNYIWHKLTKACANHGIATDNAHDAAADCKMTYELIKIMAKG